jgi:ABC-type multidrug transport system fused ATPase/permease subunit
MDVIWMRLLWLVLFFFFGTGFLIYILFWILIPQAETSDEILQMTGEPVNIINIERKIREEFQDVSTRVKNGANEVSETFKSSEFKNKAKSGLQEVVDTIGKIILAIFKVFGKLIGALLIFIAAITLIALIIGAFSWGSVEMLGFVHYPPFFFDSILPMWLLVIFGFLAIAIPFIVLFMMGLKFYQAM